MVFAWYLDASSEDQRLPHKKHPNDPVSLEALSTLGVFYWKIDADNYEQEGLLQKIRHERGYTYNDEITIHPDKLPNYEEKIKNFFTEHLHTDEEIRFTLDGGGYFDVRDKNDQWIRIQVTKGDLITLPAGIYHRFTTDQNNYIKVMRLFVGEPVWTAHNRPADEMAARVKYAEELEQTKRSDAFGVGSTVPSVTLFSLDESEKVVKVETHDAFKGKRVVLFGVPGAFTPTCTARHLPGFVAHMDALRACGVNLVACLSVNDAFVMNAWGKSVGQGRVDLMLGDGNGVFAQSIGQVKDCSANGMGSRCNRFSMLVDDLVCKLFFVDMAGLEQTSAEVMLRHLQSD